MEDSVELHTDTAAVLEAADNYPDTAAALEAAAEVDNIVVAGNNTAADST